MVRSLDNEVCIVTGASSGIGRGIATRLCERGARTVVAARRKQKLEDVARSIRQSGGDVLPVQADVTVQSDVEELVRQALDSYGRIDLLVNNAGIAVHRPMAELTLDDFEHIFAVNLFGLVRCTKAVVPHMVERGEGTIINISSGAGKMGYAGGTAYCASKHAVNGFADALYQELRGQGVQVYTLCPGAVDTSSMSRAEQDPERRQMLQLEDVVDTVEFLATRDRRVSYESIWTFSRCRG